MKKQLKIYFSLMICCLFCLLSLPVSAKTAQISLNGKLLKSNISPIQEKGTTLVPLRLISENLGAAVNYNSTKKEITIQNSSKIIKLYIGSQTALLNDQSLSLSIAPKVVNGTTMVPLRFIGEQLDCVVKWDAANQLVSITSSTAQTIAATVNNPTATIVIKDYGTVTLELYPNFAPNTVANFMYLANKGFYDSLCFHRVIKDFMIQGGDPQGNGTGGPGYSIPGEFTANGYKNNTLSHTKGVISMARSGDPDSAGSQFFITSADALYLDGQYAAFGKVISGMAIIEAISKTATDSNDKPVKDVVIESIRVEPNDYQPGSLTILNA